MVQFFAWLVAGIVTLFLAGKFLLPALIRVFGDCILKPLLEYHKTRPSLAMVVHYEEHYGYSTGVSGHGWFPQSRTLALIVVNNGGRVLTLREVAIELTKRREGATKLPIDGTFLTGPIQPGNREFIPFVTWPSVAGDLLRDGARGVATTFQGTKMSLEPEEFSKQLLAAVEASKLKAPTNLHPSAKTKLDKLEDGAKKRFKKKR